MLTCSVLVCGVQLGNAMVQRHGINAPLAQRDVRSYNPISLDLQYH